MQRIWYLRLPNVLTTPKPMKKLLLALLGILCLSTAYAQTPAPKPSTTTPPVSTATITVKGTVVDSANGKPVGYVTVALQNAQTQVPVKSGLTKDDGTFKLTAPAANYKLALAFVGYTTKFITLKPGETEINVGSVKLAASTRQLKEVAVTAVKPVVTQEIDRIGYNVQADPERKSQNVLDMLRKVPLITIDGSDNIQLKGESNYKILINGKPSSLVAHNPSDVFKSMPASSIEKIEVITTPPAKYDAEGLAGIINIITKKKVDQGYNAGVNVRENTVWGPSVGGNINLKEGKIGVTGYMGFSRNNHQTTTSYSELKTFVDPQTDLQQNNTNSYSGHYVYSSFELSYEIDTLNLITGSIDYNQGSNNSSSLQQANEYDFTDALIQRYNLQNDGGSTYNGLDLGVNYQLGFKSNKDRLLTASYKFVRSTNPSNNTIDIFNRLNYGMPDYMQQNNEGSNEHTIQLDYVEPLKKLKIEGGVKGILRGNFADYETSNRDSLGNYVRQPQNSNDFNYQQNIYSFYNTYQLNLTNWGLKAGLRAEETTIDANFVSQAQTLNTNYLNVIPSVSAQRKFKNNISVTFGFTNRIQRPSIWQLDPFEDRTNPKFVSKGNPDLKPVLNHSFEFNFSKFGKGNINVGMNYSFANNTIQSLTTLQDTVTTTTYQNIGSNKNLGLNANASWPLTKKINLNLYGRLSDVWLRGFVNSQLYSNSGIQGYASTYINYLVVTGVRLGANVGFYSSNITLQGRSNSSIYSSLSINKDVLKKKGSIFFSASNFYQKYRNYISTTNDPQFYRYSRSESPYRNINFGFNYRFGRLKSEIKKNQRGINNDDSSGKSSGSGQ